MLLPLARYRQVGLVIGVPLFLVLAANHIWAFILGQLNDARADFQTAISARMALLGNRVGAEFEREVRERLSDLHSWQENAVRGTATLLVQERINLI
jgi:hypothetical protein